MGDDMETKYYSIDGLVFCGDCVHYRKPWKHFPERCDVASTAYYVTYVRRTIRHESPEERNAYNTCADFEARNPDPVFVVPEE